MTPEIRLEAIKIAHTLHTDVDSILASAGKFIHFIAGTDAPPAKTTKAATTKVSTEQTQPATQPSTASAATPSAASTAVAQEPAASPPSKSVVSLVYDDVKKLILKLTPLNRNAALKVLEDHGVTKGPDLKPEQYDSAHKALSDAITAHDAAKA